MSSDRAAQLVEAGVWLKLSGDRDGARKLFERALKLDPDNQKALEYLAEGMGQESSPSAPSLPSPTAAAPAPPPIAPTISPFDAPSTSVADMDWGMATGFGNTPAPPPEPVVEVPIVAPAVAPPPSKQTLSGWTGPAGKQTLSGWSEAPSGPAVIPLTPQTISLSGEAPAESPPRSTPPLFSAPAPEVLVEQQTPQTIRIGGDAGPDAQPPSTPPLFGTGSESEETVDFGEIVEEQEDSVEIGETVVVGGDLEAPDSMSSIPRPADFQMPVATAAEPARETPAWGWSASPPPAEPRSDIPAPRPSPSLSPSAESAWDARSNPGIKLEAIVGRDKALELISSDSRLVKMPEVAPVDVDGILRGARDLLDLDDHTGAMELIMKAHAIAPNDPKVLAMRERSEKTLLTMFESKLGKLETIPRVLLKDDEIIWLNLDHRAGFVLAQIDGTVSFDDLFSVSGMSRIDTARILAQLVDEGVISRG